MSSRASRNLLALGLSIGAVATISLAFASCDVQGDAPALSARRAATLRDATAPSFAADAADVAPRDVVVPTSAYCSLPGSVVSDGFSNRVVPGGDSHGLEKWLTIPAGFCAHWFAHVPYARQVKVAPGGDLFVASPGSGTTGGGNNGLSAIVVVPDDDGDGVADETIPFLGKLPSTQGMLFANGWFYYQDGTIIRRILFVPHDRAPRAGVEVVADLGNYTQASEHWPKVFDIAQDGTLYVTNGSTQGEPCLSTRPFWGGIVKVNPLDGTTTPVAKGFRNPIAMKCEADHDVCLAVELALDYSDRHGGREKVVPVRDGDDWGFPCCGTKDVPYTGVTYRDIGGTPDCSGVAQETASFIIGHTPFGIDFAPASWPAPWGRRAFVTVHGDFSTWYGARMVALALDPDTGLPLPATELDGGSQDGNMLSFANGWDDHKNDHGRPAAVTFAPDGRLYLADDYAGVIVWIAPVDLLPPSSP